MRVLFVENAGNRNAGAFHSMIALICLLREYGVESHVALPDTADGLELLEQHNIPYITMRECSYTWMVERKFFSIEKFKMPVKDMVVHRAAKRMAKYIQDNRIDIVHENTSACYIGAFASKIAKVKHIWHIREFMEEDFNTEIWWKNRAFLLMNDADAVVAISDAVYNKYKKVLSNKNFIRIYNGIITDKFYDASKKILTEENIKILCVGRLSEGKGQKDLIMAIGILKEKYALKPIVLFAGSYDEKDIKDCMVLVKDNKVTDQVKFLGQVDDIHRLYNEVDIFCMCSHCEAFGRVTVEAMLSGTYVVGSNSGGTPEILNYGEYGSLYSPRNYEELAYKIKSAIENKGNTIKTAQKGREYVKKTFDAKINAAEIYNLYRSVLKK